MRPRSGIGLGAVFVHTLTVTDVEHNGLHIPKEIVSVLNIPEKGNAVLMRSIFGVNHRASSYYTCKDRRVCLRNGWSTFANENELGHGMVVLIFFHKNDDRYLMVTFDVL